jgi:hypothetical protein
MKNMVSVEKSRLICKSWKFDDFETLNKDKSLE